MKSMMQRSKAAGVKSMIVTGGSLKESERCVVDPSSYQSGVFYLSTPVNYRALEVAKEHGATDTFLEI
jgi:hypothetical protein